ncbi:MAG: DUF2911 domain-containing protein [Saprospiraceae bacterium]|nr:DUF2911 domain-containing protein [Saprospiraceae bacterium]
MKRKLILFMIPAFALMFMSAQAQDKPSPSPMAKVTQMAGTTEITIEYSRPSLKGRTIFPDMHKYGEFWRTGANAATKISFSKDVIAEGKSLSAGSYAILTKPGEKNWEVYFYTYDQGGWNSYPSQDPAAKVMVEADEIGCEVESFLINLTDLRDNSATLGLVWGTTYVPISLGLK